MGSHAVPWAVLIGMYGTVNNPPEVMSRRWGALDNFVQPVGYYRSHDSLWTLLSRGRIPRAGSKKTINKNGK